ncbi:MAG: MFS transporter [Chloroflexota bacterium]|nr:MFS transporter [Chloroflexota bacterium]
MSLIIMGDSILYVILPTNFEFFGITSYMGIPYEFWIGFILSINRFVRFFSNIISVKIFTKLGFRSTIFFACFLGAGSTLFYALFKGVILILIARIIWGFSYSLFRLGYQLKVFSFSVNDYGKYLGYCLGVQRTGSFLVVTLGVLMSIKFGIYFTLIILSLLIIPALLVSFFIKDLDLSKFSPSKINWNLSYNDQDKYLKNKIINISFFKFSSSFTSNGLAIATITPFLLSINKNFYNVETILAIAGFIVGFRWIADIFFGIIFGTISDKFGRKINIIISTFLMIIAILLSLSGINFYLSIVCIVLMFFFSVSLETSLDSFLGEISPEKQKSSIVSRYSTWQDLGAALGPMVGFIFATNLGISFGYYLSIFMLAICIISFLKIFTNQEN